MLLTVCLRSNLPHGPPLLIGQATRGSSAKSIRTSAPAAPAWTTASVSTRPTPSTASAPQVRLPYRYGGGRRERAWGQGAQRLILLCLALFSSQTQTHTHKHWSGRALIPALRRAYAGPGSPAHTQQLRRSGKRKSIRKGLRKFEVFEQVCYPFYQVWWSSRN